MFLCSYFGFFPDPIGTFSTDYLLISLHKQGCIPSSSDRIGLGVPNVEDGVKVGVLEDQADIRANFAQPEDAAFFFHLPMYPDQLPEHGTGEEVYIGEIQDKFLAVGSDHDSVKFLAQASDRKLFGNLAVVELDHHCIVKPFYLDVFGHGLCTVDFRPPCSGLGNP